MRIAARLARTGESATLAVQELASRLRARGVDVVDLGLGEPDFATPKAAIDGAVAALEAGFTRYTATAGIAELREAVARCYRERHGGGWSRESVVVTVGAKQALYNVFMALCDPGDEVIVPTPCWVSIPEQVRLADAVPRFVACSFASAFVPDPADVERALGPRTRAILVNSPCNPTGAVVPRGVLAALVEIARARGLFLISDETYDRFVYGDEHVSAASFHRELGPLLVLVNSFSKTYAMTGLRVGYVLADPALAGPLATFQSHTTSNATSISQRAALAALQGPQASVGEMLREYRVRRDLVVAALSGLAGVELVPPAGAFYAFPRVEGAMARLGCAGSADLASLLLETAHVALVPGAAFAGEGFLRLSFAIRTALLEEGLVRLRRALGAAD